MEVVANSAPAAVEGINLPDYINFDYQNFSGERSSRSVQVLTVTRKGSELYFAGICEMAGGLRTFRLERVQGHITRYKTAEVFMPLIWADMIDQSGEIKQENAVINSQREYSPPRPQLPRVLFTGFAKAIRAELEAQAVSAGWEVGRNVGKTLDCLVAGPNAGPSKLVEAAALGIQLLTEDEFRELILEEPVTD